MHRSRDTKRGETMRTFKLKKKDIITPYFVVGGKDVKRPIRSMPGIYHFSVDNLIKDIRSARGIEEVLLFGVSKTKNDTASAAYHEFGLIQKAIRAIKKEFKNLKVVTDVCLCAYTSHGHCRILKKGKQKAKLAVDKKATLETLAKIAVSHARAGADFVAPSAVMDGQVAVIRHALDCEGFKSTKILAYSAKYASNFYGPFREALNSSPKFGDRTSYQLDPRNTDRGLAKIEEDIKEGADLVMVKPALAYLDILYKAKKKFKTPIAAFSVSGEYTMIKKLADGDSAKEKELVLEALTSMKRAGADRIITYFGKEVIKWLG
ncbi:MAG: porphobilinogen synthase [Candidatus Omnitrophica bacterium]|nr:porphobilinogen synthase [Candidatus Omnitrophota bacterium]